MYLRLADVIANNELGDLFQSWYVFPISLAHVAQEESHRVAMKKFQLLF